MSLRLNSIVCFFITLSAFPQGEANYWYFGQNAGLDFTSGSPVAISNGQINTNEGCAVLSNASGQLLFYTDGVTVYNRNHQIMANGTGLMGHPSSTQSATIVNKPNSSNLYYVFTLDANTGVNGFRYSVIDLNLNGGLGDVTSEKNSLITTPSCEKLAVVKHANNVDYWILVHGINNNIIYSYLLTSSGLSASPVNNPIGVVVPSNNMNNVLGYMKTSPDGKKLVLCHTILKTAELFDFDNTTGIVSNPIVLLSNDNNQMYGAEFSPNGKVLYISFQGAVNYLSQFNLSASNIPGSKIQLPLLYNYSGGLQLGPDGKIYLAQFNKTKLTAINNPNNLGSACNIVFNAVDLNGRICKSGLPAFNQSFFFTPSIQATNLCVGQNTTLEFFTNQTVLSANWNFGDGNTSNNILGNHTYTSAGTYTVTVNVVTPYGTGTGTKNITINSLPNATQPANIVLCDNDNNGIESFDLTTRKFSILNGQNPLTHSVTFYASWTDYTNNIPIGNPSNYINLSNSQSIIAEVDNGTCKKTTTFTIQIISPATSINLPAMKICDNTSFGTNNDGIVVFNLTTNGTLILNSQLSNDFSIQYYQNSNLTQLITNPSNYINTNTQETIYVKIINNLNNSCFIVSSFEIEVYPLPVINSIISLKQCDDNNDGFSAFNLTEANQLLVANTNNLTITYHETYNEADNGSNAIINTTAYTNQVVSNDVVYVRIENEHGCHRVAQLNLNVSTTNIPSSFQKTFTVCDDTASGTASDGIATFNFSSVTSDIQALYPVGQALTIAYYKNLADALAEQNPITNTSTYTNIGYPNTQNIYVRVDSQVNNECLGLGHHITLNVERIPFVNDLTIRHCDDNQDGMYAFDTSTVEQQLINGLTGVQVTYTTTSGSILPSPLPNPFNTTTQDIIATVTNSTSTACNDTAIIHFIVDDLPEVFPIASILTTVCDDEAIPMAQDGMFAFNTTTYQSTLLGGQTGMTVNYYAANGTTLPSPLPNPFTTSTQNVTVEIVNPTNTQCKATYTIPFIIKPLPLIELAGSELVCSNDPSFTKIINAGVTDVAQISNYTYQWYLNGTIIPSATQYDLTVNTEGVYTCEVTYPNGCSRTRTITVTASNSATIEQISITDLSDNNSIVVYVSGSGDYEYSLDGINYQTNNIFNNLNPGVYNVYINDVNGCGEIIKEVSLLGIPNYFTPNGDGFNDTWNIKGITEYYNSKSIIYIFDRYGKLIKHLSPHSNGWDGTYNGNPLPASDYWYNIKLEDGRVFKGHFSLKR